MDAKITALTEELNKVKTKAREEAKRNRRIINELKNSLSQQIAERKRQKPQPRQVATGILIDLSDTVTPTAPPEPMEFDPTPAPPPTETAEVVPTPLPRRTRVTRKDLEEWPALRPPIRGVRTVIPDTGREFPPPEIEMDLYEQRESIKRRKGLKGPAWDKMEAFPMTQSGATPSTPTASRKETRSETTSRPPPPKNDPSPVSNGIPATGGKRRERRREKRRLKRQEEAGKRAEARSRGDEPPGPSRRQSRRETHPPDEANPGPASRTRSRTRVTTTEAAATGGSPTPFLGRGTYKRRTNPPCGLDPCERKKERRDDQ